jgi:hypothetical protein
MALSVSGFEPAFDYRIVYETTGGTTANKNVTLTSGSLLSVDIDNQYGTNACYVKIFDGDDPTPGTSIPQFTFRCASADAQRYEIPGGVAFSALSFWVTRNASPTDTAAPTVSQGGVIVSLVTT